VEGELEPHTEERKGRFAGMQYGAGGGGGGREGTQTKPVTVGKNLPLEADLSLLSTEARQKATPERGGAGSVDGKSKSAGFFEGGGTQSQKACWKKTP